jgi:glycosyltransferase involved in cell wall biosynthesis
MGARLARAATIAALLLALGLRGAAPVAAAIEPPPPWSPPTLVAESPHDVYEPALTVDSSTHLQLAWSTHADQAERMQHIVVARQDGSVWSPPVAVIASSSANSPALAADAFAELHLIWAGAAATLYYRRAPAAASIDRQSWSTGVDLEQSNLRADLRADAEGRLHLAYPAHGAGGPMYLRSDNGGAWWSRPVRVADPAAVEAAADYVRIAPTADGMLHVVWTEFAHPKAWPPRGVFYARSTDQGRTWTAPARLAADGYDQINVAADGRTVHVAWNGIVGTFGRYHRVSHDAGTTWSPVARLTARGATEGPPQLLIDSAQVLHVVTTYDAAAWHLAFDGATWSTPVCLSCAITPSPTWLEEVTAAVRGGNELHAVFWDGRRRLWHAAASLAAPRLEPPTPRPIGWWSSRRWLRETRSLLVLLAAGLSVAAAAVVRQCRSRGAAAATGATAADPTASPPAPAAIGPAAFFPSAEYLGANPYWPRLRAALQELGVEVLPSTPLTFGRRWLLAHRTTVRLLHLHFVQPFYAYEATRARFRWVLRLGRTLLIARLLGMRTVFTLHDLRASHPLRPAWVDYLGHWTVVNLADEIIVHCQAARTALRRRYGRRGHVHVIEHPGYVDVYPETIERHTARAHLGLEAKQTVFLFFGELRPYKGVDQLLDAFAALPTEHARLLIVGRSSLADPELTRLRERCASDPRVRLDLRYVADDEVAAVLRASDVVVLPFRQVLTSASAILAMSFARVVVAPALGCLPELLADGAGVLYDPGATDGLGAALRRCLAEDLTVVGERGFARVRSRTWQAAAAETVAVYRHAAER